MSETSEPSIYHDTEETYGKESLAEEPEEQAMIEDATAWYQEAVDALLEEPEDSAILATFKEARKALDAARTARGFYPVRNPNARRMLTNSVFNAKSEVILLETVLRALALWNGTKKLIKVNMGVRCT